MIKVDVCLIVVMNCLLEEMVKAGEFWVDLYY